METKPLSELIDLSGKTAIVTGGALGIGRAIAARLAEAGAGVLIADRDAGKARDAAAALAGRKGTVSSIAADVSSEEQVAAMVAQAVSAFGGVDMLVNNAGIYPMKPAMEASRADFEEILAVNLVGAFLCSQAAARQMLAQGRGGRIINITSIDALHPSSVGLAFYDASKHGLWGFTKNLALELAPHRIWVNAIAPGGVATPGTGFGAPASAEDRAYEDAFLKKIPLHRIAEPDEIARVALFLASDLSTYQTGSQIVVDGGTLLS